jgi:isopenicillin-N N-acyltransferase-like protein
VGQWIHRSTDGLLTHTNHCIDPGFSSQDRYVREYPETRERYRHMQAMAKSRPIAESDVRAMLADHTTAPNSICLHNHTDWSFSEQGESIASIIFDLTGGTLDIADGPPCQNAYQRYDMTRYLPFA